MKINILSTLSLIRFCQIENIKSITYLTVSQVPQLSGQTITRS